MRTSAVLAVLLVLGGCKKDVCTQLAKDADSCGKEASDSSLDTCQERLETCSTDEEAKLEAYRDCLLDVGAECGVADDPAAVVCYDELEGVSEECSGVAVVALDPVTACEQYAALQDECFAEMLGSATTEMSTTFDFSFSELCGLYGVLPEAIAQQFVSQMECMTTAMLAGDCASEEGQLAISEALMECSTFTF